MIPEEFAQRLEDYLKEDDLVWDFSRYSRKEVDQLRNHAWEEFDTELCNLVRIYGRAKALDNYKENI